MKKFLEVVVILALACFLAIKFIIPNTALNELFQSREETDKSKYEQYGIKPLSEEISTEKPLPESEAEEPSEEETVNTQEVGIEDQITEGQSAEDQIVEDVVVHDITGKETVEGSLVGESRRTGNLILDMGTRHYSQYYYNLLSYDQKDLYSSLYRALGANAKVTYSKGLGETIPEIDTIDLVYNYLLIDHPELYFVDGVNTRTVTIDDIPVSFEISGRYSMTKNDIYDYNDMIVLYVEEFDKGIKEGMSDYDKIKYAYEYIIDNTEYSKKSINNQNILSVFMDKKSVCSGYARALQYLLNHIGIEATIVIGNTSESLYTFDGGGHAWNLVRCNGKWYYVDPTWGDPLNEEGESNWTISYNYLLVPYSWIENTHFPSDLSIMPECNSIDDNYFVKEKLYFTKLNVSKLRETVDKKIDKGAKSVIFKFADKELFDAALTTLIDEQRVFDLVDLEPGESVSYSFDDKFYEFELKIPERLQKE